MRYIRSVLTAVWAVAAAVILIVPVTVRSAIDLASIRGRTLERCVESDFHHDFGCGQRVVAGLPSFSCYSLVGPCRLLVRWLLLWVG